MTSSYTTSPSIKTTTTKHRFRFTCTACKYETNKKSQYDSHLLSTKHIRMMSPIDLSEFKYQCPQCVYGTHSIGAWDIHCSTSRHVKLATNPTEWPCKCGRYFHSDRARTYHGKKCGWEPSPHPPPPTQAQLMQGMMGVMTNVVTPQQSTSPTICLPISEPSYSLLKARMKDMEESITRYRDMNDQLTKTIKTMQEWTADGGLKCNICETMKTGLELYEDQYGKQMICNTCCVRMTGFASVRIEKIMVEYLQVHYEVPMSVIDKRIKNEACLAYRPDVMYIDFLRVVHVECDENQHNSYTCDEKRMSDMYGEYPGKTAIWIRWNPHAYKAGIKTQGERLRQLVHTLKQVETMEFDSKIHVIYMYYDQDHPSIVKNISHSFIY